MARIKLLLILSISSLSFFGNVIGGGTQENPNSPILYYGNSNVRYQGSNGHQFAPSRSTIETARPQSVYYQPELNVTTFSQVEYCPKENGMFPTSDGDYSKYLMCQEGQATIVKCSPGLTFNPQKYGCDLPQNLPNVPVVPTQAFEPIPAPVLAYSPSSVPVPTGVPCGGSVLASTVNSTPLPARIPVAAPAPVPQMSAPASTLNRAPSPARLPVSSSAPVSLVPTLAPGPPTPVLAPSPRPVPIVVPYEVKLPASTLNSSPLGTQTPAPVPAPIPQGRNPAPRPVPAPVPVPPPRTVPTVVPYGASAPVSTLNSAPLPARLPAPYPNKVPQISTPAPGPVPAPVPVPSHGPVPAPVPAPSRGPVPAPVPAPSRGPVPAPVPVPSHGPVPAPVPAPSRGPVPAPVPAPSPGPVPAPVPAPSRGPVPTVVPYGASAPDATLNSAPLPARIPVPIPVPARPPVQAPAPAPASTLSHASSPVGIPAPAPLPARPLVPAAAPNAAYFPYSTPTPASTPASNLNSELKEICPKPFGFFPVSDGECSTYMSCQEGKATIMNCPPGLVFNPDMEACDWPENVAFCNPNVFKDFTCPESSMEIDGSSSGMIYKYRYGNHCRTYVACHRGYPRLLRCDAGMAFDESSQSCVYSDYVMGCGTNKN